MHETDTGCYYPPDEKPCLWVGLKKSPLPCAPSVLASLRAGGAQGHCGLNRLPFVAGMAVMFGGVYQAKITEQAQDTVMAVAEAGPGIDHQITQGFALGAVFEGHEVDLVLDWARDGAELDDEAGTEEDGTETGLGARAFHAGVPVW